MQRLCVRNRFLGGAHVGLGNDFKQWHACPVEIDAAHVLEILVQRLARVLFEVGPRQANRFLSALRQNSDFSPFDDRELVLADLVALGKVRIEIVLAGEDRAAIDVFGISPIHGQAKTYRFSYCLAIRDRKHARQGDVHCIRLRVGRRSKRGRSPREHLRHSRELRVSLKADDDFPVHAWIPSGSRLCQSVAF